MNQNGENSPKLYIGGGFTIIIPPIRIVTVL